MARYSFETIAVDAVTPVGLTTTQISTQPMRRVFLSIETQSVRLRYDGGPPSTTVGHLLVAGSFFTLDSADAIRQLRLIATTGTASIHLTGEAA